VVTVLNLGGGGYGNGSESWIDKLLPVAVLAAAGYLAYTLLIGGTQQGSNALTAVPGGGGGGSNAAVQTPADTWTSSGNQKGATVVSPSGFAQSLVQNFQGTAKPGTQNVLSGASWTRYAIPASPANIPAWQPPGLIPIQSGRDQPFTNQIAEYNPATGNAWGGALETVKYLYTAGPGLSGSMADIAACRTAECVNAQTAAAWRAQNA
jgi:hypothetical protein